MQSFSFLCLRVPLGPTQRCALVGDRGLRQVKGCSPEGAAFELAVVDIVVEEGEAVERRRQVGVVIGIELAVKAINAACRSREHLGQLVDCHVRHVAIAVHLWVPLHQLLSEAQLASD